MKTEQLPSGVYVCTEPETLPAVAPEPPVRVDPATTHEAAGNEECCVAHLDGDPRGCKHCRWCKQWVRPHRMGEVCPGRVPT